MTQPSKAPILVLGIFGTPFAGCGLWLAWKAWNLYMLHGRTDDLFGVAFGLVFFLIGCAVIYAGFGASKMSYRQAALEQANPTSPWLWREDWAQSRANNKSGRQFVTALILAGIWNAITIPLMIVKVPQLLREANPALYLIAAFGLAGLVLLAFALYWTMRRERFGSSYFQFESLPFVPGGHMRGTINLKFNTRA